MGGPEEVGYGCLLILFVCTRTFFVTLHSINFIYQFENIAYFILLSIAVITASFCTTAPFMCYLYLFAPDVLSPCCTFYVPVTFSYI